MVRRFSFGLVLLLGTVGCRPARMGAFPDREARLEKAVHATVTARSAPEAEFTTVTGLAADSRGRIYAGDWMRQRVTVISPGGRVLGVIGRNGAGPGEFRSIRGLQAIPGDTILVYDPELARVTFLTADPLRVGRVLTLPRLRGDAPFFLWRLVDGGFVGLFRSGFMFNSSGSFRPRRDSVALLAPDGSPRALIARVPARGYLVARTSITPNPFGREPLARVDGRGRVHYVWTDSLAVRTYDGSGRPVSSFSIPYHPPPVTDAEARAELEAMGDWGRRTFQRALSDSVPRTWPAVREMLVDDADRLWMALPGPRDTPREWAVFTSGGRYMRSVLVPEGVTLWAVRSARLYGERKDDDDVPAIVVLTLDRPL
ncbi:MAG TPA: hypothetical protein VFJ82_18680 [Longimicrobium sp.]|nr:hypothetical protein [Longimicrobium sp.]